MKIFIKLSALVLLFSMTSTAASAAGDPLKKMAKELAKPIQQMNKPVVGFLAFSYPDGTISNGSKIVCERLTTYLASMKKIRVVERELIVKLLEEEHMEETGAIDPSTVKKMGQILGVDILVTGTLINLDNHQVEVNARGLMSDSGIVVATSRAVIQKEWRDQPKRAEETPKVQTPPSSSEDASDKNEAIEIGYPIPRGPRR